MDPLLARKTWRTVEPVHGIVYFARERDELYDGLGLRRESGYFASRAAAMGAVDAAVVVAAFFNFEPRFVERAMDGVWDATTPSAAIAARTSVADGALRRLLGDAALRSPELSEASKLAKRAAERAAERPEGRPLFAGHLHLEWPPADEPHLVLWHAQTLLREFRGDGHVSVLTSEGVTGCEALVVHAATGEVPAGVLRASRMWSAERWDACVEGLRTRGWVDGEGRLTERGWDHRRAVEDRTDRLSVHAYEALGVDGCERLRELVRPLSKAVVASGELGFREPA